MTPKQLEVLIDVITTCDPWIGCRGADGRKVAGRRKTLEPLIREGYISIGINWQTAWATDKGLSYVRNLLPNV